MYHRYRAALKRSLWCAATLAPNSCDMIPASIVFKEAKEIKEEKTIPASLSYVFEDNVKKYNISNEKEQCE